MRSLEVNWLRRFDKSLVIPQVVYCQKPILPNGGECGGFYLQPGKYEVLIDGQSVDAAFGILVVSANGKDDGRSVIAHEWRHHWQLHNGIAFDHKPFSQKPYEDAIRDFFRHSKSEMDALQFEAAVAPSDLNDYWMHLTWQAAPSKSPH